MSATEADDRIQTALERLKSRATPEAVADLLEQTAEVTDNDAPDAFTEAQEEVLASAGMPPVEAVPLSRPSARSRFEHERIHSTAYTTTEVAEMLDVTAGRIRQHAANRTLLTVKTRGNARFPRFQFTADGDVLPGWETVAPHFPRDAHPLAVEAFLGHVSEELEIGDRLVSPSEWLSTGGEPSVVADLVDDAYLIG